MTRDSVGEAESLRVRLETAGTGTARASTGLPVLDDLLVLLAETARFDLTVQSTATGSEPEVEAIGAALGAQLAVSLGQPGARRLGSGSAPQDEALASVVLEASGRPLVLQNVDLSAEHVGGLRGDLLARLLAAIAEAAGLTIHVRLLHGHDTEHVLDAIAKALGLALAEACGSAT
jgi:imidazoleglycerol-phosphate dehydratase